MSSNPFSNVCCVVLLLVRRIFVHELAVFANSSVNFQSTCQMHTAASGFKRSMAAGGLANIAICAYISGIFRFGTSAKFQNYRINLEGESNQTMANEAFKSHFQIKPEEVLDFWFGKIESSSYAIKGDKIGSWFTKSKQFDDLINLKFGPFMKDALGRKAFDEWKSTPKGMLALIIVADQFSRNVYRNKKGMFASDSYALELCKEGIKKGYDGTLFRAHPVLAMFFYMPLMHSENYEDHKVLMQKSKGCASAVDEKHPHHDMIANIWPSHIAQHAEVIKECGRYPQRNHILGRKTSPKEQEMIEKYNLMDLINKKE